MCVHAFNHYINKQLTTQCLLDQVVSPVFDSEVLTSSFVSVVLTPPSVELSVTTLEDVACFVSDCVVVDTLSIVSLGAMSGGVHLSVTNAVVTSLTLFVVSK